MSEGDTRPGAVYLPRMRIEDSRYISTGRPGAIQIGAHRKVDSSPEEAGNASTPRRDGRLPRTYTDRCQAQGTERVDCAAALSRPSDKVICHAQSGMLIRRPTSAIATEIARSKEAATAVNNSQPTRAAMALLLVPFASKGAHERRTRIARYGLQLGPERQLPGPGTVRILNPGPCAGLDPHTSLWSLAFSISENIGIRSGDIGIRRGGTGYNVKAVTENYLCFSRTGPGPRRRCGSRPPTPIGSVPIPCRSSRLGPRPASFRRLAVFGD